MSSVTLLTRTPLDVRDAILEVTLSVVHLGFLLDPYVLPTLLLDLEHPVFLASAHHEQVLGLVATHAQDLVDFCVAELGLRLQSSRGLLLRRGQRELGFH